MIPRTLRIAAATLAAVLAALLAAPDARASYVYLQPVATPETASTGAVLPGVFRLPPGVGTVTANVTAFGFTDDAAGAAYVYVRLEIANDGDWPLVIDPAAACLTDDRGYRAVGASLYSGQTPLAGLTLAPGARDDVQLGLALPREAGLAAVRAVLIEVPYTWGGQARTAAVVFQRVDGLAPAGPVVLTESLPQPVCVAASEPVIWYPLPEPEPAGNSCITLSAGIQGWLSRLFSRLTDRWPPDRREDWREVPGDRLRDRPADSWDRREDWRDERGETQRQAAARAQADADRQRAQQQKAEADRLAQERQRAEVQRQAAARAQADAQQKAEAERQRAEADRQAGERQRAEARRQATARAQADADRQRAQQQKAEADRLAQERQHAEAQRQAVARAQADAQQKAEAERQRAEADRQAGERQRVEAQRQAAARAQADADRQRAQQQKAEVDRQRAATQKAAEDRAKAQKEQGKDKPKDSRGMSETRSAAPAKGR